MKHTHTQTHSVYVVFSDTSAGLQRILQEIQPRDTNDFFTSARELDSHSGAEVGENPTALTHTPSADTGESEMSSLLQRRTAYRWLMFS